jgi:hypothetical protein
VISAIIKEIKAEYNLYNKSYTLLNIKYYYNITYFRYNKKGHYIIICPALVYYNYKKLGYKVYIYLELKKSGNNNTL